jgi:hypothetical protein
MHEPTTVDPLRPAIYYASDVRLKSRTDQAFNSIVLELSRLLRVEMGDFRASTAIVLSPMWATDTL